MFNEKIDAFFAAHKDEMVRDIKTLVDIRSVRGEPKPQMPFGEGAAAVLSAALEIAMKKGFAVKNFDNYVGTVSLNGGETVLGILAHLDTVPEGDGWDTPPFSLTEKDGRIYGRGTADDKGPAVAALYAMCAVREILPGLSKNVRLILGTDEECGSSDLAYYLKKEPAPPFSFTPDANFAVINVEKGQFRPVFEAHWPMSDALPALESLHAETTVNVVPHEATAKIRGIDPGPVRAAAELTEGKTGVRFDIRQDGEDVLITATGTSAHAASPQKGNNALTALLQALAGLALADGPAAACVARLHALFPHGDYHGKALGIACADEVSGELTLNFSILDLDAEGLTGKFDCRFPLCADGETMRAALTNGLAPAGMLLTKDSLVVPHHVPQDSLFVQTLLRAYEERTGEKGGCMAMGGGTYVHNIEGGVAFGCAMPNVDNRMHGANEFAVVDDLVLRAKIFARVIADMGR
jgi:succinyl-diaminopimelate desuccinylase